MGVPAFFRWLTRKYPSVIIECVETKNEDDEGNCEYEDGSKPNPNGVEFDNLYLDMNGIIHPCTHPEDKPAPKNEDEMMIAIFAHIDRLFNIVRPRKLIYMAVDGVAPRAKMNQQRSRRFRAAKEVTEKQLAIAKIREKLLARGARLPPEKPKGEYFDSNCITPGTPFMQRLSSCLHYYIHDRLNNNPGWKGIKVILSDANVPGEGEHKIMDYIRKQRAQPNHDPNTHHVLCGADADLIMLGLATHETYFTIIREEFKKNPPRPCEVCGRTGHDLTECVGEEETKKLKTENEIGEVKFIFVRLPVLKEYLQQELVMPNLPFKYEFERALDDWVFMCFFVGNDFLPHLPSLDINESAIDRLVTLYKKCVYQTEGYLTDSGDVDLERVQIIITNLGEAEDEIFKNRKRREEHFKEQQKRRSFSQRPDFNKLNNSKFGAVPLGHGKNAPGAIENPRQAVADFRMMVTDDSNQQNRGKKRKAEDESVTEPKPAEEDPPEPNDEVRLWEDGFKDRYYESKFDVSSDNLHFRYSVALQYVRGLCWVLKYYYQGCASWKWYFPYHYAPFASDFHNIAGILPKFEKNTKPFEPLEQLMGVFPAASSSHVPIPWADLMSNPESNIIDFYPEDFRIDLNGKRFAWQGVALLPFVDENRLFSALNPYRKLLTKAEQERNSHGCDRLFIGTENSGYNLIKGLYKNKIDDTEEVPILIDGVQGQVLISDLCVESKGVLESPILGLNDIGKNRVVTVKYLNPVYADNYKFLARKLQNAKDPPTILKGIANQNNRGYKPRIGFSQNYGQASLDPAGHRMVDRATGNIPPPSHYGGGGGRGGGRGGYGYNNYNNRGGREGGGGGGGGGGNYGGGEGNYGGYRGGNSGGYRGGGAGGGYSGNRGGGGGYNTGGGGGYNTGGGGGGYNTGGGGGYNNNGRGRGNNNRGFSNQNNRGPWKSGFGS